MRMSSWSFAWTIRVYLFVTALSSILCATGCGTVSSMGTAPISVTIANKITSENQSSSCRKAVGQTSPETARTACHNCAASGEQKSGWTPIRAHATDLTLECVGVPRQLLLGNWKFPLPSQLIVGA